MPVNLDLFIWTNNLRVEANLRHLQTNEVWESIPLMDYHWHKANGYYFSWKKMISEKRSGIQKAMVE